MLQKRCRTRSGVTIAISLDKTAALPRVSRSGGKNDCYLVGPLDVGIQVACFVVDLLHCWLVGRWGRKKDQAHLRLLLSLAESKHDTKG